MEKTAYFGWLLCSAVVSSWNDCNTWVKSNICLYVFVCSTKKRNFEKTIPQ